MLHGRGEQGKICTSCDEGFTEPMLEFSDIFPDLLAQTRASGWMTNVPGYVLGLSRGSGLGKSVIGLGFTDSLGNRFATTVNDFDRAEWILHDGVAFGSQQVSFGGLDLVVDWAVDDLDIGSSFSIRVSGGIPAHIIPVLFFEEIIVERSDDGSVILQDHLGAVWTVATSVESYTGIVTAIGDGSKRYSSPSTIAGFTRDVAATVANNYFVPKPSCVSPGQSVSFLFFKDVDRLELRIAPLTGENVTPTFPESVFESRKEAFKSKGSDVWTRRAISNLFGSLGRFTGDVVINDPARLVTIRSTNLDMTSIGPSRSKFPRPFLWDDGFHLLAIDTVNRPLAVEIVTSWLRAQSVTRQGGWIPRELALSLRDKAAIPPEFLAQNPLIANPTTLTFVIRRWMREGILNTTARTKISAHLIRWYTHLEKFLKSDYSHGTCFRWKDRSSAHCLSSGLDDYPRGYTVNKDECHLDLHMWLMMLVDTIHLLGKDWSHVYSDLKKSLFTIFKVQGQDMLSDYMGTQYSGSLPWRKDGRCGPGSMCSPDRPCCDRFATCRADFVCTCPDCKMSLFEQRDMHSPHSGYVTLFPLILGRLDPDNHKSFIVSIVEVIENKLMCPFGVMSLAKSDPFFGKEENYWRGNVWANLNLLTVGALRGYGKRFEQTDSELASWMVNLADRISTGWKSAMQAAWTKSRSPREYLNPETGEGGGALPFAGWTAAAMVLIDCDDFWTSAIGI